MYRKVQFSSRFSIVPPFCMLKICTLFLRRSSSKRSINCWGSGLNPSHTLFCRWRKPQAVNSVRTIFRFRLSHSGMSKITKRGISSLFGISMTISCRSCSRILPLDVICHWELRKDPLRATSPCRFKRERIAESVRGETSGFESNPKRRRPEDGNEYWGEKKALINTLPPSANFSNISRVIECLLTYTREDGFCI